MNTAPPPEQDHLPLIPWEDPDIPLMEAVVATVKLLAIRPSEAFAGMPATGGIGRPLLFAVVIGWIGTAVNIAWNVLFQGAWLPFVESAEEIAELGAVFGLTIGWGVIVAVLAPVLIIIGVFIAAAVLHLMLLIVGGANSGFEATARVVCYTQTAQLAGIIPCCGGIVGLIWTIVLFVVGFSTAHRTSQGKALVAILLPIVLCCSMAVVAFVIVGGIAGLAALASSQ